MINASLFEKSIAIFEKIKTLDKEILSIEQLAQKISDTENDSVEITVSLNSVGNICNGYDLKQKMNIESSFFAERLEYYRSFLDGNPSFTKKEDNQDNPDKSELKESVSINVGMQILGVILSQKLDKRKYLIDKLAKIGVTL